MLDAEDKRWRQCEPVNNIQAIDSCTFGIDWDGADMWKEVTSG